MKLNFNVFSIGAIYFLAFIKEIVVGVEVFGLRI